MVTFVLFWGFLLTGCISIGGRKLKKNAQVFTDETQSKQTSSGDRKRVEGKYPGNLIRTRTAKTLAKGKSLAIFSASYRESTTQRIAGKMHKMPWGIESERFTTILVLQHGITDRFQMGLVTPFVFRHFEHKPRGIDQRECGLGDIVFTSKYALLEETKKFPGLSLGSGLKLPTGNEDKKLGTGEYDGSLFVACSKRSGKFSFHGSLQYIVTGGSKRHLGPRADDKFIYSGAVLWHLSRRATVLGELTGMEWGNVGSSLEFTPGLLWKLSDNFSIKGGVTIPLHIDMPFGYDIQPTLGCCYRF